MLGKVYKILGRPQTYAAIALLSAMISIMRAALPKWQEQFTPVLFTLGIFFVVSIVSMIHDRINALRIGYANSDQTNEEENG